MFHYSFLGVYFTDVPDLKLGFGSSGLVLCRVLVGNEFEDQSTANVPTGYHTKVLKNFGGSCNLRIVPNPDRILPCYTIRTQR